MNQKNPHYKWIEQIKVMICSQLSALKGIMVHDIASHRCLQCNESSDRCRIPYTDCKYGDDGSKARLFGSNAVAKGWSRLFSSALAC